jgi:hypothetical protein
MLKNSSTGPKTEIFKGTANYRKAETYRSLGNKDSGRITRNQDNGRTEKENGFQGSIMGYGYGKAAMVKRWPPDALGRP